MMLRGFANQAGKDRVPPTKPVHVLVVEDDDVDVMAIKRAFRVSKIDNPLWIARDGIEALAILRGEGKPAIPRPYLILLDLNMPRMNGIEFLQELRADPDHGGAVVFVLTTSATDEDKAASYNELVAGYIVKANAGHDFLRVVKLLEAYWTIVEGNDELRNANRALRMTNERVTAESIETARLNEELKQMAFSAAVAGEQERRRIAIDLHDRIGQSLALAQIKLQALGDTVTGAPRTVIDEAVKLLARSIVDARTLTFELSPPVLYDLGLKAALAWLVEDIEKRHGMRVDLYDDGMPKALDEVTASLIFRAVRELLMNVFKHAKAVETKVSLRRVGDQLEIDVEDKGVGFDPVQISSRSGDTGFGLFSVREQIRRLGGTVEVVSAPQRGTRVGVRVPLQAEARGKTGETEKSS